MNEYIHILSHVYAEQKKYGDYFIYSVWKDIEKNVAHIDSNLIPQLDSLLIESQLNLDEINYDMNKKVSKALTDKIEDYVQHIMSRRGNGKAFSNFLSNI